MVEKELFLLKPLVTNIRDNKMKRQDVYKAIDSERDYQDYSIKKEGTHVVKELPLGSALSAIKHKLDIANKKWYGAVEPHQEAMDELRKIAAICVQMGEKFGMPKRKPRKTQNPDDEFSKNLLDSDTNGET